MLSASSVKMVQTLTEYWETTASTWSSASFACGTVSQRSTAPPQVPLPLTIASELFQPRLPPREDRRAIFLLKRETCDLELLQFQR